MTTKVKCKARLFTASLYVHAKEEVSEASAKHAGDGVGVCERSEQEEFQVFRIALARSSLASRPDGQRSNKNTRK